MKVTSIFFAKTARFCVCAVLLGLAVPLAAHPAGDYLPEVEGAVTLLTPGQVKDAPFLPGVEPEEETVKETTTVSKEETKTVKELPGEEPAEAETKEEETTVEQQKTISSGNGGGSENKEENDGMEL